MLNTIKILCLFKINNDKTESHPYTNTEKVAEGNNTQGNKSDGCIKFI